MKQALREDLEAEVINAAYQRQLVTRRIEQIERVLCLDDLERAERARPTALVRRGKGLTSSTN